MLGPDCQCSETLGESGRHETAVFVEGPDVALIACIENDRSFFFVEVLVVDKISHHIGVRVLWCLRTMVVKVINCRVEPVFSGLGSLGF